MQKSELILIAEDEPTISRIVISYLEREGYRTELAVDGLTANLLIQSLKPDLVVLDITMPERNGLEVLKLMREETDTPVILLSARSEANDKALGFDLGANDYVSKPFSARDLVGRVKAILC